MDAACVYWVMNSKSFLNKSIASFNPSNLQSLKDCTVGKLLLGRVLWISSIQSLYANLPRHLVTCRQNKCVVDKPVPSGLASGGELRLKGALASDFNWELAKIVLEGCLAASTSCVASFIGKQLVLADTEVVGHFSLQILCNHGLGEFSWYDIKAIQVFRLRVVRQQITYKFGRFSHHEPDHKGCHVVTFDGKSRDAMQRHEPRMLSTKACDSRNLYAVVDSDGVVVTAGHRFRRVPRDLSLSSLRPGRSRRPRALHSPLNAFHH